MSSEVVVRVEVTAEDIANGEAGACRRCPVALAANRATGRDDSHVSDRHLVFQRDDFFRRAALPDQIRAFIQEYDHVGAHGWSVHPLSFDLSLAAELVLKGGET